MWGVRLVWRKGRRRCPDGGCEVRDSSPRGGEDRPDAGAGDLPEWGGVRLSR